LATQLSSWQASTPSYPMAVTTVETGLIYIYRLKPAKAFVGCGALIEGGYVATCRHVWRAATGDTAEKIGSQDESLLEIEYPRSRQTKTTIVQLSDVCILGNIRPDLVLLTPQKIPTDVMPLQLAVHERFEVGLGYAHARLARTDPTGTTIWKDVFPKGEI